MGRGRYGARRLLSRVAAPRGPIGDAARKLLQDIPLDDVVVRLGNDDRLDADVLRVDLIHNEEVDHRVDDRIDRNRGLKDDQADQMDSGVDCVK